MNLSTAFTCFAGASARAAIMAAYFGSLIIGSAHAGDKSDWVGPDQGKLRLLAGGDAGNGALYAGLEIDLEKGY